VSSDGDIIDSIDITCNEAIATVSAALEVISGDLKAALSSDVIKALAMLKANKPVDYMVYRKELASKNSALLLSELDKLVSSEGSETTPPSDNNGCGATEAIVGLVEDCVTLFVDDQRTGYARIKLETHCEYWPLNSTGFREWLSYRCYRSAGRVPKSQQLNDALQTLNGKALYEGEVHPVHLRAAADKQGGYYIDICDDLWRVVHVTARGWQIIESPPIRFRRTSGMQALPVNEKDSGSIEDLRALVNVEKNDELLLVTAMLDCWRPDTAYPVLEICGEQGSGKSATTANIRRCIDPNDVLLRARPKNTEDVFVSARNNHTVAYENLSHLSSDMQDGLCTLSTGGGFAGRTLYTNDEETTFDVKRPVLMNGINALATRPDLLSRVVRIVCPALEGNKRISDAEVKRRIDAHGPKALSYLLTLFSKALARLPEVKIDNPPRLADFAQLGEAVAFAEGEGVGAFIKHYNGALSEAARQALEGMPAVEALIDFMEAGREFNGTIGDLLKALEQQAQPLHGQGWPRSPRGFGVVLDRATPALRHIGIRVRRLGRTRLGSQVCVKRDFSSPAKSLGPNTQSQSSQSSHVGSNCTSGDGCDGCERCRRPGNKIVMKKPVAELEVVDWEVFV